MGAARLDPTGQVVPESKGVRTVTDRVPRGALAAIAVIVLASGAALVTAWATGSWSPAKHPETRQSIVPNVVHDGLAAAERSVVAAGFTYRDWASSGGAIFGRNICHPAVVFGERPAPGLAERPKTVVTLLVGPGNVRCHTTVPQGDGTVVGVLKFSGGVMSASGDSPRAGRVVAGSHVALSGVLHVTRVGTTGIFRLALRPGEWHIAGFTPSFIDGNSGKPAECFGENVRVRAHATVRADVVCVGL